MMELFVTADNLFNRVNYGGYSGNLLSDYFGQPTMAQRPRQVQVGMQFRFYARLSPPGRLWTSGSLPRA